VRRIEPIGSPRLEELARTAPIYDRAAIGKAAQAAFGLAFALLDGHPEVKRHRAAEARVLAFLDEVLAR
jgi:hypothetical protein